MNFEKLQKNVVNPFEDARCKLETIGQQHLLDHWNTFTEAEQNELLQEIDRLDLAFFEIAQSVLQQHFQEKPLYSSLTNYEPSIKPEWTEIGNTLIKEGKCALLVLAGGSGSRLHFEGPKGCFPITNIRKKSLFQYMSEKVVALSQRCSHPLNIAIMTSPTNHADTVGFFEKNAYFGLQSSQVHFFSQKVCPLLSLEGKLFLETPSKIACGPNGNGEAFKEFFESPIFAHFQSLGIEYINVVPIENPLADPFDAHLLGFQHSTGADVSIKAVLRKHAQEKVGVIVEGEKTGKVVEYSEVRLHNEEEALAFIGLFSVRMTTITELHKASLPLHVAKKQVKKWENGTRLTDYAWKFERFLFETFSHVSNLNVLLFPRKMCFAPLKNFEGDDSIAIVQEQLQAADRQMYYQVSGQMVPESLCFELSPKFYYPSLDLKARWQGKLVTNNSYIEDL